MLINWYNLKNPLNFLNIFGNDNPVDCEIGFGEGDFLLKKCKNEPERNFIGIEYSKVCTRKALKKINNYNLNNIRLILLDAESAFDMLIPEISLDNIYINFPDPWPKNKHEKRRLLDRDFSILTSSRLKDNGKVHILTDHTFYRDFILEEMSYYGVLRPLFNNGYKEKTDDTILTKYEKKWRSEGRKIYYIVLQKVIHPFYERKIRYEDIKDGNVKLKNDFERFYKKAIKDNNSLAKITGIKRLQDKIEIETILKDWSLFQKCKITLIPDKMNEYKLIIPENVFRSYSLKLLLESIFSTNN